MCDIHASVSLIQFKLTVPQFNECCLVRLSTDTRLSNAHIVLSIVEQNKLKCPIFPVYIIATRSGSTLMLTFCSIAVDDRFVVSMSYFHYVLDALELAFVLLCILALIHAKPNLQI